MHSVAFVLLALLPFVSPTPAAAVAAGTCTNAQKQAAMAAEIQTIRSHSAADAAKIPLTAGATRTFFVTPSELGGKVTLPPINVGVSADTVRAELVALATILDAGVPSNPQVNYTFNANGTATSDFIQTDRIVLPYEHVREIHTFDLSTCKISQIIGYVHGNLICPTDPSTLGDAALIKLCTEYLAADS